MSLNPGPGDGRQGLPVPGDQPVPAGPRHPMRHPHQKVNRKRKGKAGGRPVTYDRESYTRRNESGMQLQHPEAMAVTGHPGTLLALTYRAAVFLQAVIILSAAISALGDTPQGSSGSRW